jgi:hypothetical protein
MTETSDVATSRDDCAQCDVPTSVGDVDAVKVESFAFTGANQSVAAVFVEHLDETLQHRYDPKEPWRSTDTISRAVVAASRPLFSSSFDERSSACSSVLTVNTPKATGTRVLS